MSVRGIESKILAQNELLSAVIGHKKRSHKIVFANGCFDVLHVGHVRYLEAAKAEGDVLVVGINSDASVRALKGKGQPILSEETRKRLVAGLRCVDYVAVFTEANVEPMLELIGPDVHGKGTDYTVDTVPERALAARLGIRVAIVGDPKDHSTRSLLSAIRQDENG